MSDSDLSLPRGIRDIEPAEYELHSRVREAFEGVARSYNFRMMEPASLERLSTLRAKSGEEVDKEIYSFKDKGGREVGLRFDLTVGMTRYVCSRRDLKLPAKLASFGGMWRYDEPQYARYRWAHQWDLEVFGAPSVDSDAEVIDASAAILRRSGVGLFKVRVGDRRVVEDYVRTEIGVSERGKVTELMRALDKVGKKSKKELADEYFAKGFKKGEFESLMKLGDLAGPPEKVLGKASEMKLKSTGELAALSDALRARGVREVEYNMSIVRGIDYYTGIVFEGVDEGRPRLGSLFGGGRYDALPKLFGRPELSATGAAGGVERESMSMAGQGSQDPVKVHVAFASEETYLEALKVLSAVRNTGVRSEVSQRGKSLGKQLEEAAGSGASWAVIIGKREQEKDVVTLRNMEDRSERQVSIQDALKTVR
ncbi:MAG: histidine--tRNA ligase [Thaumarchaeota archaeon]|nr:histidine--tRNA ligase [Nitrososphaerota archaeon]